MTRTPFAHRKLAIVAAALAALGLGVQSAFSVGSAAHQSSIVVSGSIVDADRNAVPALQVVLNLPVVSSSGSIAGKSLPIGSTRTDDAGHFAIRAEVTPQLQKLGSLRDGWLNFDLLVFNSTVTLYRAVPRQIVKGGWVGPPETNGSTDLGTLVFAARQPGVGTTTKRFVAAAHRSSSCIDSNTTLATATLLTKVLEVHTATGPAHINYGPTADSYISVIVMIGAGPWSEGAGDFHVTNTLGSAATLDVSAGYHHMLRSYFKFVKVRTTNPCTGVRVTIKGTTWTKNAFSVGSTTDPSKGCTVAPYTSHVQTFAPGAMFTRNANPANRWPSAVDLTTLGGPASLANARSGYSSKVWVKWQFPSGGKLCGYSVLPSSSLRIFAGA
jgi:hypothetical protein